MEKEPKITEKKFVVEVACQIKEVSKQSIVDWH